MNTHLYLVADMLKSSGFRIKTVTSTCIEVFLTTRSISINEVSTALENAFDFDPASDYHHTNTGSILVHVDME